MPLAQAPAAIIPRMAKGKGITTREDNYSEWYMDIVQQANLAEHSVVRGCMVIKPHGYRMWELMQGALDRMFKETGHQNAYFPLLIPKSFLSREAEHVEGFATECAVVTHHRLKSGPDGMEVDPDAKLEEEYVIRPTSETIIWDSYRKWIQSHRDLPLKINQWANVMRWELRPRLFLRTAEFLWQEGHTAHATYEDAEEEAKIIHDIYRKFAEDWLAVPVMAGVKSKTETFAGADHTYTIEAMTQDLKAIQAGTSHHLGQNFAKAFDVTYQNKEGQRELVWATSWGVSTRLIGTLIMAHSDDSGLIAPPRIAPVQVAIIPIGRGDDLERVIKRAEDLADDIKAQTWSHESLRVTVDDRDKSPGFKFNDWELHGACLRIELGPRDLEAGQCVFASRLGGDKITLPLDEVAAKLPAMLEAQQNELYDRAMKMREANTHRIDTWDEFKAQFKGDGGGGFVLAHWDGTEETEKRINEETKATIRLIPETPLAPGDDEPGECILTGRPSERRVVFAKAY